MGERASQAEIFQIVTGILRKEFDLGAEDLQLDTHLIDELDLDSIDAIDMAVRVEERLSVSLDDDDLKSIRTIRDVVELIDGRL
jgi:acyl carrier protein